MERATLRAGSGLVVVERHGGRVAELRPREDLPNLLWRGDEAPVPGGDRLWPAPELEVFYADASDPESWRCPPELDPGSWRVDASDEAVALSHEALGARFTRHVRPVSWTPPLEVPWTGYRVADTVRTARDWSAWHIVMVPAPTHVHVREARDPTVYYPPVPEPSGGWYRTTGRPPRWKVGFPASADGRAVLASFGDDDPGPVVVLLANADPGGTYVDVPPHGGPGTAVQLYDAGGEGFCELEHHAPLETRRTDATVIGAWGTLSERHELLRHLEREPAQLT